MLCIWLWRNVFMMRVKYPGGLNWWGVRGVLRESCHKSHATLPLYTFRDTVEFTHYKVIDLKTVKSRIWFPMCFTLELIWFYPLKFQFGRLGYYDDWTPCIDESFLFESEIFAIHYLVFCLYHLLDTGLQRIIINKINLCQDERKS